MLCSIYAAALALALSLGLTKPEPPKACNGGLMDNCVVQTCNGGWPDGM